MAEQLPSRMNIELSLAGGESVEVYDRAIGPNPAGVFPADVLSRFEALPPVLRGYLLALAEDRLDGVSILTFADWLEEHGQAEAGQRVRLLRPQPGDVLVLWPADRSAAQRIYVRETAEQMRAALPVHTLECHDPDSRVEAIDPEQLRAAGWVQEREAVERVRAEREACADLVENAPVTTDVLHTNGFPDGTEKIDNGAMTLLRAADAIRARGE